MVAWLVAPWLGVAILLVLWPREQVRTAKSAGKGGLSEPTVATPAEMDAAEPGHGRAAVRPGLIPAKGWRDILWRVWKETSEDRLQIVAAGVTFYVLLAIFPALGAFVSLYGLFADVGEVQAQLVKLSAILPPGAVEMIGKQMLRLATSHDAGLGTAFLVGLLLSLWTANAGMKALFDGMNIAYDESEKRGFVRLTLLTLGFTLGAVVFLVAVNAVMLAVPLALGAFGFELIDAGQLVGLWAVVVVLTVTAFSLLYRYGPSRKHARWRWLTWGGIFAAAAWLLGSLAYSAYVNNFAHFDRTYGSLGVLVGFMVWLWFTILMILLGAELNSEIEHQTAVDTTTGAPEPMGARGAVMADTVGQAATVKNKARAEKRKKTVWGSVRN